MSAAASPEIEAAFRRHDYARKLEGVRRTVCRKWPGLSEQDCEDAVSEALVVLLRRKPHLFAGPPFWMGLLVKASGELLAEQTVEEKRLRLQSIDALLSETGPGDNAFSDARLLGSGRPARPAPRGPFGALDTARLCAAFWHREGRWPNSLYFAHARDFDLPPVEAAHRYLGGITARAVQRGVETILSPDEIRAATA